ESGHQRHVGVRRSGIRGFLCDRSGVLVLPIRSETPGDMNVRVDPTGHHREAAQIAIDRSGGRIDADDLSIFNDDARVAEYVTFAVEQGAGGDHDAIAGWFLRAGRWR